jgi:UDP-galactopyranose mutase
MKKAVIIGAGFAGCIYGMMLKEKGWHVTVVEKDGVIGGGVRTFFHGGHPYTFGPRHFLSPFPETYEFIKKYLEMRDLHKINYTYMERDQRFYTYPIHDDDIDDQPEGKRIRKELSELSDESEATNFEEFWKGRVGPTLYEKFVKHYNKKAWMLDSNNELDLGYEGTVKKIPLETGDRTEFKGWANAYPVALDGYNSFLEGCLEGCDVRLNSTIEAFDVDRKGVRVNGEWVEGDMLISSVSPDILFDNHFGPLRYVGREFHKFVLPIERVFPKDVYFLYYPNANEQHTRIVEYKTLTGYDSPHTLLGMEVPSMKNRLYPMMIKSEVERAQKYLAMLPDDVYSVGRMGIYKYVDMDDIILDGMKFRDDII